MSKLILGGKNMKKLLILFMAFVCLTGCGKLMNTPTKQVEELFSKYQSFDNDIKTELDTLLSKETFTESQKQEYRDIIKKQYKNLTYTIKDEKVDGNNAIVTTEIEVLDFKKIVNQLDDEYSTKADVTTNDYIDEKIKRLKNANDKIKYTLEIEVTKDENNNWKIVNLTDTDIKKIQGMY